MVRTKPSTLVTTRCEFCNQYSVGLSMSLSDFVWWLKQKTNAPARPTTANNFVTFTGHFRRWQSRLYNPRAYAVLSLEGEIPFQFGWNIPIR